MENITLEQDYWTDVLDSNEHVTSSKSKSTCT